jgi:hypothetical protein
MSWMTWAAAVVVLAVAGSEAHACQGRQVLLEDNFTRADKGWALSNKVAISNGALTITPEADAYQSILHQGRRFEAADICVNVTVPQVKVRDDLELRLLFLAEDPNHLTYFWMSGFGGFGVKRAAIGTGIDLVSQRKWNGIDLSAGRTNRLRLSYAGNQASIFLNDNKLVDLRVQPVGGGGMFGFGVWSEVARPTTWSFSNLKVTSVP